MINGADSCHSSEFIIFTSYGNGDIPRRHGEKESEKRENEKKRKSERKKIKTKKVNCHNLLND